MLVVGKKSLRIPCCKQLSVKVLQTFISWFPSCYLINAAVIAVNIPPLTHPPRWTPDRKVRVRALAGSLCCVLGQNTLLSRCLSPPGKPDEMLGGEGGVTCGGLASHPGGVAILIVTSCKGNRDKLRQCGPLGSCVKLYHFLPSLSLLLLVPVIL